MPIPQQDNEGFTTMQVRFTCPACGESHVLDMPEMTIHMTCSRSGKTLELRLVGGQLLRGDGPASPAWGVRVPVALVVRADVPGRQVGDGAQWGEVAGEGHRGSAFLGGQDGLEPAVVRQPPEDVPRHVRLGQ